MNCIEVKEYDSLRIGCTYTDEFDNPIDISGLIIKSHMKSTSKDSRIELDVEIVDAEMGEFILKSDLKHIPPRDYFLDIRYENKRRPDIAVTSSDNLKVRVIPSITVPSEGMLWIRYI